MDVKTPGAIPENRPESGPLRPRSHYQPINAYGVIGNCQSAVLIDPDGSVDWGCFPDFDSPALFCRLLDTERGGYFQIAPTDITIHGTQRYLRGSNVLQTSFTGRTGTIVLTDFMPLASLQVWPYQGMDNDTWDNEVTGSCHCLVRSVECTSGLLAMTMRLRVTPQYAAAQSEIFLLPPHTHTSSSPGCAASSSPGCAAVISGGGQHVGLAVIGTAQPGDDEATHIPTFALHVENEGSEGTACHETVVAHCTLRQGERLFFTLGVARSAEAARRLVEYELPRRNFAEELAHTLHCWRRWVARCSYRSTYADAVQRSVLALKMMTYAPTGALIAAPTTSLPETLGGIRNWDYRYTWLRDASFTLNAFNVLGFTKETQAFTQWLCQLTYTTSDDLQIMYGLHGERDLTERELPHLSGYKNSRPVRIGNGAARQKQLDVFGEVLDCIDLYQHLKGGVSVDDTLEEPLWRLLCLLIEHVCTHWHEADAGIWEVRGGLRHFVYSKAMCWVALDRGIHLAERYELKADVPRWRLIREHIHGDILAHGYNSDIGAFTQSYGSSALDASCLLLPLVGFIPHDDPRMLSTIKRIMDHLTDDQGFVYRYHADDGLIGSEGTFALCTFWLIDNLALQGRIVEAKLLFERILAYAGPLGLFSEEIDTVNNLALGNYPQAFTHIGLITSALRLEQAEQRMASAQAVQPL